MRAPPTRYAKSDGLSIAYQHFGSGPIDLVYISGFVSHLDLSWELLTRAALFERLGRFARVLTFDKRGTGLSDRMSGVASAEERMDDIRAVMDAAGVAEAAFVGVSEGGPLALLFAATYPERVRAMVLSSTFARMEAPPNFEELLGYIERTWGTGDAMAVFLPDVAREDRARYERSAATPSTAVALLRMNLTIDVTAVLPAISVPVLVVHNTGDPVVPVERGRELAGAIAGARLVERESAEHVVRDPSSLDGFVGLIEEFLTGAKRAAEADRVLATVLFTDIVRSTEAVAAMGDARWRPTIGHHLHGAGDLVERYRGRVVASTGDGLLATFDGPARAVRCAADMVDRAQREGLTLRAGLHTGEVEVMGDSIAGIGVHLAKRVEAAAEPGEVWTSQTVHDLVVGSGLEFSDRGEHVLKGVPGRWRLYRAESAYPVARADS